MHIIGLMGAERAGKSTVARHLVDKGFQPLGFATALKRMLKAGFGLTDEQLNGSEKETPCSALCGRTPRFAMRMLGSEFGRRMIHKNLWVETLVQEAEQLERAAPGVHIVVEDVRFANEIEAIHRLGGEVWLLRRPAVEPDMRARTRLRRFFRLEPPLHASNVGWSRIKEYDRVIHNDGDLGNLRTQIDGALEWSRWQQGSVGPWTFPPLELGAPDEADEAAAGIPDSQESPPLTVIEAPASTAPILADWPVEAAAVTDAMPDISIPEPPAEVTPATPTAAVAAPPPARKHRKRHRR